MSRWFSFSDVNPFNEGFPGENVEALDLDDINTVGSIRKADIYITDSSWCFKITFRNQEREAWVVRTTKSEIEKSQIELMAALKCKRLNSNFIGNLPIRFIESNESSSVEDIIKVKE